MHQRVSVEESYVAPRSRSDWRRRAACADSAVDPEVFFRQRNGKLGNDWARLAKQVCARCSVDEQCLQVALEARERAGVWGGMTPPERRRVSAGSLKEASGDGNPLTIHSEVKFLSNAQWARIEPMLPAKPARGRQWRSHRQIIEGIAWKYHTKSSWRALPASYGSWSGVFKRHHRWLADGTWRRIEQVLLTEADPTDELDWLHLILSKSSPTG
ncbi:transposase [Streptomyces cinereoruber]|uniref:transposase n=1 Tax=Streptomyces cinereoruber TaxID=67260 RepID=UPI003630E5C9